MDVKARTARWPDHEQSLSRLETELLVYLAARPGQPVTRDALLMDVWGYPSPVVTRAVDNTMGRLRSRVEREAQAPDHLLSLRGVGYTFVPLPAPPPAQRRASFHGRQDALEAVDRAFAEGQRLVTLRGPGGIGKTRIAAEWAAPRGVRVVPLKNANAVDDLVRMVADAVGIGLPPGLGVDGSLQRLGLGLAARAPEVMVLDELETLVPSATDCIARLMAAAPGLRLLCTSRVQLGMPDEWVIAVGALSPVAAREMLQARMQSAGSTDLVDAAALDRMVDQVDRLPLAIELVAPRLAALGPQADAGDLLSLDGVHARSWALLDQSHQDTLLQCALFEGPFTVADLAVVAEDRAAEELLDSLTTLVQASLVHPTGTFPTRGGASGELSVLWTTRTWLLARTEPRMQRWRLRAAHHLLNLANDHRNGIFGPDGAACCHALARIGPTLRRTAVQVAPQDPVLAVKLLLVQGPALLRQGPLEPELLDRALRLAPADNAVLVAQIRCLRGALAHLGGRLAEACTEHRLGLDAQDDAQDAVTAELQVRLGYGQAFGGELAEGLALCVQGQELAASLGCQDIAAMGLLRIGAIHHVQGAALQARRALRAALVLHQEAGDAQGEARTLGNLALFDLELGIYGRARSALERALESARRHGATLTIPQLRINLGGLAHLMGDLSRAQRELSLARRLAAELGDSLVVAIADCSLGVLWVQQGDLSAARRELSRARLVFTRAGHAVYAALCWEWLALIEAEEGDGEAAQEALCEAEAALPEPPGDFACIRAAVVTALHRTVSTGEYVPPEALQEAAQRSSSARLAIVVLGARAKRVAASQ